MNENQITVEEQQDIALRINGTLHASDASHNFTGIDGRCMDCDARPWGVAASAPCPRW